MFRHNITGWAPPIELQRSTPREVRLTAAGRAASVVAVLLVAGAIGTFAGLYGAASQDAKRWAAWQSEAVATEGRVVEARKTGSGDDARIVIAYQYYANGTAREGRARLRYQRWRYLRAGMPVPVVYRRSESSVSWIAGAEPKGVPLPIPFLVAGALLIPVPLIAFGIRRQRRLLEEGRPARATVVETKKVSSQHGGHYRVTYEFETLSGTRRTGKYQASRKSPEVGEQLIVVYHPDEEKWSARYPMSLVKVASNE